MTIRDAAGRCLMVGFEGASLERTTRARLLEIAPGGIILFRRNLDTPERLADLLSDVDAVLPGPLLVALDQEGGRVSRLASWIGETPSAAALAHAGVERSRRFAQATGAALRALRFNVDLAPVVDLSAADATNGIADRSFGADPERVALLAGAFLDGLQATGVAGCLKHFPGLGGAAVDSHVSMPIIERAEEDIVREDLVPFTRLATRAAMVLVGHAHYPSLDAAPIPATLSLAVVSELLRERVGFRGLVLSDDMEMGSLSGHDEGGADAVRAMQAGCDLLLYCKDLDRAARSRDALLRAAERDGAFAARLLDAADSVARTACAWPRAAAQPTAFADARRELQEAARLA